jgi:hypothetical protein
VIWFDPHFLKQQKKFIQGGNYSGYRLPDGKKGRYFCCIVPQKKENDVLLGFEYGIAMQDPKNHLEGKGTKVRFVRVQKKVSIPTLT